MKLKSTNALGQNTALGSKNAFASINKQSIQSILNGNVDKSKKAQQSQIKQIFENFSKKVDQKNLSIFHPKYEPKNLAEIKLIEAKIKEIARKIARGEKVSESEYKLVEEKNPDLLKKAENLKLTTDSMKYSITKAKTQNEVLAIKHQAAKIATTIPSTATEEDKELIVAAMLSVIEFEPEDVKLDDEEMIAAITEDISEEYEMLDEAENLDSVPDLESLDQDKVEKMDIKELKASLIKYLNKLKSASDASLKVALASVSPELKTYNNHAEQLKITADSNFDTTI